MKKLISVHLANPRFFRGDSAPVQRYSRLLRAPFSGVRCAIGLLSLAIISAGCSSIGPSTVPTDKFDYNGAIAEAQQQELLLNLVRLRYREPPVFLKVSSVISQYSRAASTTATAGINTGLTGNDTAAVGGRLAWTDRPVITYMPVSGQEFSRNLLTPLPPKALFRLAQSGWSSQLVFRSATMSFNGLWNDRARLSYRQQGDPALFEMLDIWQRLRDAKVLDVSAQGTQEQGDLVLFVDPSKMGATEQAEMRRFRDLLGASEGVNQFRIVQGLLPQSDDEIAVLTGSLWDIMVNIAWQFDAPPEHVTAGRTGPAFSSLKFGGIPPIQVRHSSEEPGDTYAKVFTQNYWFYIDNTDMDSKQTFSFLQLLLSLAETTPTGGAPVLTISN